MRAVVITVAVVIVITAGAVTVVIVRWNHLDLREVTELTGRPKLH